MDTWSQLTANRERIAQPTDALHKVLSFAESRGFVVKYETVGTRIQTTTCTVEDTNGASAVGRGKGLGVQSVASAVFEAFEHYFHKVEDTSSKVISRLLDIGQLDKELQHASPDFKSIFRNAEVPLTCLGFNGLESPQARLGFPAILMNPAFVPSSVDERVLIERSRFFRYSSNSGTAAGLTSSEAILHGLLEVIERDAISMALVRSVLSPSPDSVRVISLESLTEECLKIISDVIKETDGAKITLWDIASDIGVPCVLCALTAGDPPLYRFFGSGASLCAAYALERAILEALQGYHLQFKLDIQLQIPPTRNINRMSLFQRCDFSAGYFEYRGGETMADFSALPSLMDKSKPLKVEAQIQIIVNALSESGMKSYFRTIYDDAFNVSQVLVPQLERLFLLTEGLPVAPSSRARAARRI